MQGLEPSPAQGAVLKRKRLDGTGQCRIRSATQFKISNPITNRIESWFGARGSEGNGPFLPDAVIIQENQWGRQQEQELQIPYEGNHPFEES
jgi:hypothetical protein